MTEEKKTYVLISEFVQSNAGIHLDKMPLDGSMEVIFQQHKKDRSLAQNNLSFRWYKELGKLTGHGSNYERARCKLHYGVPILRAEDSDFNAFYVGALINLTYEQKLKAMEYVPVTSLMKTKPFAEYLNTVDQESAKEGRVLSHPEDLYHEALMNQQIIV